MKLEPLCRPGAAERQPLRMTPKQRAAQQELQQRFHHGFAQDRGCYALLDVLRLACDADPTAALMDLDFLRSDEKHRLERKTPDEFLPYLEVHWFSGQGSVARLCIDSGRQAGWLPRYRITIYANDKMGLLPDDLLQILEVLPSTFILMLELALDFPMAGGITRGFIRRHGVFGKSRRYFSVANASTDWWGAPKARKRTKAYTKSEIAAQRVEWKLLKCFLDVHGIRDVFDFHRLAELLPDHHGFFGQLSEERLVRRLRNLGYSNRQTLAILRNVRERRNDMCSVLDYLRRDVRLTNVRRLLVPLPENELVRTALAEWAVMWPTKPRRLRLPTSGR